MWHIRSMPRLARLDAPGVLHHIMIRGIERCKIFLNDKDREDFRDKRPWQDVDYVLGYFGRTVRRARKAYLNYVDAGVEQGRRDDLTGSGLRVKMMVCALVVMIEVSSVGFAQLEAL